MYVVAASTTSRGREAVQEEQMHPFAKYAARVEAENQSGKPTGIWVGYSKFEIPEYVIQYEGQGVAHVLCLLFHRASGKSYHSTSEHDLALTVREDSLALKSGLSTRSIERALAQLESDRRIRRVRRKHPSGRFLASRITLLDDSAQALQTSPQRYGLCRANDLRPFITMPRACLDVLSGMTPSQKATYISALALASREKRESVFVDKPEWFICSRLGENAFGAAVAHCKRRKLLTYSNGVLTLNDPQTGRRTERWKHGAEWVEHIDPEWDFDLNEVTAEQWHYTLESLLSRKFEINPDGWTLRSECPFCFYKERFHANFTKAAYRCHSCDAKGRLGQLVARIKNVNMTAAKEFIKEHIEALQKVTV